jgi:hypothetical protein
MHLRIYLSAGVLAIAAVTIGSRWPASGRARARSQLRTAEQDRTTVLGLEDRWLAGQHDGTLLEVILAADFVHPVPSGDLLDKGQHIRFATGGPSRMDRHLAFDRLQVRLYGDTGIVNGVVVARDKKGREIDRSIFTDVFVFRDGRWQAVNAQENRIEKAGAKL